MLKLLFLNQTVNRTEAKSRNGGSDRVTTVLCRTSHSLFWISDPGLRTFKEQNRVQTENHMDNRQAHILVVDDSEDSRNM